ncbi:MAG: hypothetical protein AAGD32_16940 [Planctomycetota bacterium]
MKYGMFLIALWLVTRSAGCASLDRTVDHRLGPDLSKRWVSVEFVAVPFEEAIDVWSEQADVSTIVNWRVLELSGIDRTTPVDLILEDAPADTALQLILDAVGGGFVLLSSMRIDGHLLVSTRDDFDAPEFQQTRVYDVSELIGDDDDATAVIEFVAGALDDGVWRDPPRQLRIRYWDGRLLVDCRPDEHEVVRDLLSKLLEPEPI